MHSARYNFNPYDRDSWFFGALSREESNDILMNETQSGAFLIRNSKTIPGDVVLCVREDSKVSHYIINKVQQSNEIRYRIGDQIFEDIPSLLDFYRFHYLDTTPLVKPATKKLQRVRAKYTFEGSGDADDLPFIKNEILTIISRDEDDWWTAKNQKGQKGLIPVNYVEVLNEDEENVMPNTISGFSSETNMVANKSTLNSNGITTTLPPSSPPFATPNPFVTQNSSSSLTSESSQDKYRSPNIKRKLPALARVIKARVPNAYDNSALKLQVGDLIKVTKLSMNGQWEGELNGKTGHFPFTHIEFLESDAGDEADGVAIL